MKALAIFFVCFVLPTLVLGIVEAGLRMAGYGVNDALFLSSGIPGKVILNPDYGQLFYPRTVKSGIPESEVLHPVLMDVPKPAGAFRIFVLGGSTAQGFPYFSRHSFSNLAGDMLNEADVGKRVEVINLGKSAMSSYYVRETADRVWKYQPDLILIYSGHNEYYGTVGAGSGPGHKRKVWNLRLKRFRTAQLVFNTLASIVDGEASTLMEQRLTSGAFPFDESFDRIVADRFLDNLDAVRRQAASRRIPLLVVDPVSNLVSMPPFSGSGGTELEGLIREGAAAVRSGKEQTKAWLAKVQTTKGAESDARILYLKAQNTGDALSPDLPLLTEAKDRDSIPFRAREALRTALAAWASEYSGQVSYLPLQAELVKCSGPTVMGDPIFIDHLHFSHYGQLFVGAITARYILQTANKALSRANASRIKSERDPKAAWFHPAMELSALVSMRKLLTNPPYSNMVLPYSGKVVEQGIAENPLMAIEGLKGRIAAAPDPDVFDIYGDYLKEAGKLSELGDFITAQLNTSQGGATQWLNMARLLATRAEHTQAFSAYANAWLLARRSANIQEEMEKYAATAGLSASLQSLYATVGRR